jgi:hypothetical protein
MRGAERSWHRLPAGAAHGHAHQDADAGAGYGHAHQDADAGAAYGHAH